MPPPLVETDAPPRPLATFLAALWLHACVVAGILTTLQYLNVPVWTWLGGAVAVFGRR
jgi:hypothetical protein